MDVGDSENNIDIISNEQEIDDADDADDDD